LTVNDFEIIVAKYCMPDHVTVPDQEVLAEAVRRVLQQWLASPEPVGPPHKLFHSPRARELKQEIVQAGRKLWHRHYVDGNGGNISARLSPEYVICTPTMLSKGDLHVEHLSMVNLDNCQIIGNLPQTSEIHLHLQIYKEVPEAQAIIHCHPPYTTAHAIAGVLPQGNLVPEQEIFIGPMVLAPYETPGTLEFARTVVPAVLRHNTILLANHGVVCWADTVTHAEWNVEVIENYCKTVMIASQLRSPLPQIPPQKVEELLAIKQRLGMPDPRLPRLPARRKKTTRANGADSMKRPLPDPAQTEALVATITAEIMRVMESRG
jgi:L-fuculose-phosphate aldolase